MRNGIISIMNGFTKPFGTKRLVIVSAVSLLILAVGLAVWTVARTGDKADRSSQPAPESPGNRSGQELTSPPRDGAIPEQSRLTEAEIRQKFLCDRMTDDLRATDIYCKNPQYYYDDVAKGSVIDRNDFNDPRYKSLFP